jgi:hypothetical protein
MNLELVTQLHLNIVGKGEADQPDSALFDARSRSVVRYADPAAWTTAAAVARAVKPVETILTAARDSVAVLVVSDDGPQEAMQALDDAARTGFSSPLRFPAANPGSLVGVSCILLGFRGPTLNLTMSPSEGSAVGLMLASQWLRRRVVDFVLLSTCQRCSDTRPRAHSLLLCKNSSTAVPGAPLSLADVEWLGAV